MRYYQLDMDMESIGDIICHYKDDRGIYPLDLCMAKHYEGWDGTFQFYFDYFEGNQPTDYLANDMGWFVISGKLKRLMEQMNTEIQYLPVRIFEKYTNEELGDYYVANILRTQDALCLDLSDYFTLQSPRTGRDIHFVSKYGVEEARLNGADVFKLAGDDFAPIFVSDVFRKAMEENHITGIELYEIASK